MSRIKLCRSIHALSCLVAISIAHIALAPASRAAEDRRNDRGQWVTFGHDAQRSGWASDEKSFTPQNVSRMRMVWKAVLPNEPHVLTGLAAPLVVNNVSVQGTRRSLVVVAGSSDTIFAIDADTGAMVWERRFTAREKPRSEMSWLCPNALNATPAIDAERGRVFVVASDGRLYTLALDDGREVQPALRFVPAFSKMWSLNYVNGLVYSTLSQDCNDARSAVYAINPDRFGHPVSIFWSSQNCGGGFCGAGIWGRGGASADFDGFIYAATGDAKFDPAANQFGQTVVKLEPGLAVADYYVPPNRDYIDKIDLDLGNTTPAIFRWKDRVLSAVGGKEGLIYLMDAASLGGADHRKAVYVSPLFSNEIQSFQKNGVWGSISSWKDARGDVWLYVPMWGPPVGSQASRFKFTYGDAPSGSVMAFKVVAGQSGQPVLEPVWRSRDMAVPDPVAIAGGVVFALETGEDTTQATVDRFQDLKFGPGGNILGDKERLTSQANRGRAVLYALDALTGRELWTSGKAITDWTHFSGVAVGAGKVFVTTNHGELYAFGLTAELGVMSYVRAGSPAQRDSNSARLNQAKAEQSRPADAAPPLRAKTNVDPVARDLFNANCAACHGASGTGVAGQASNFTSRAWQSAHTDAELADAIRNGKEGGMPAFKGKLTDEQVTRLVKFIRSLGL